MGKRLERQHFSGMPGYGRLLKLGNDLPISIDRAAARVRSAAADIDGIRHAGE
jgi:hypothetical protein